MLYMCIYIYIYAYEIIQLTFPVNDVVIYLDFSCFNKLIL